MALFYPETDSRARPESAEHASQHRNLSKARIPRYARAALEALGFDGAGSGLLRDLDDAEYRSLLRFCDRAHLALTLDHFHGDAMPGWVRDRLERNLRETRPVPALCGAPAAGTRARGKTTTPATIRNGSSAASVSNAKTRSPNITASQPAGRPPISE
jgi:hypothetical protein